MSLSQPTAQHYGLSVVLWWALFAGASVVLSFVFQTFKVFTLTPTLLSGLQFAFALLLSVLSIGYLIYDGYVKEKVKGTLQRHFGLFERLFASQYPHWVPCGESTTTLPSPSSSEQ